MAGAEDRKVCSGTNACKTLERKNKNLSVPLTHCQSCPRGEHEATAEDIEAEREAVEAVKRLIAEDRCGRPMRPSELTPLEWELIILWNERATENKRLCYGKLINLEGMIANYLKGGEDRRG